MTTKEKIKELEDRIKKLEKGMSLVVDWLEEHKLPSVVFIPKTKGNMKLPAISFSYFNPADGKYKTILKEGAVIKCIERPEGEKGVKVVSMPGTRSVV